MKALKHLAVGTVAALAGLASTATPAGERFGLGQQAIYIPAFEFQPIFQDGTCGWTYNTWHYFNRAGSCQQFFAALDLPEGAMVETYRAFYIDNAATDISFQIQRAYASNGDSTNGSGWATIGSTVLTTSGQSANYRVSQAPSFNATYDSWDHTTSVHSNWVMSVTIPDATNQSLRGVWIFYHRQVAPAPATSAFNDVPVGHPFFNEVQQLSKSGITSGCGGGAYCPDAAVTRGQMAVFLSRALGLQWGWSD